VDSPAAGLLAAAGDALRQIRKAKSERRLSMRAEVPLAEVSGPADVVGLVESASDDLVAAGHIGKLELRPGEGGELIVVCAF
jgi:valyl-tRNA synthetase